MKPTYLLCIALLLLVSCQGPDGGQPGEAGSKRFFRYNQASGISSLDPAFAKDQANIWACNQLYNGLVQMDDRLVIQPCIAKSWTVSEDGLTYTFHLRNDVRFHNHELFGEGNAPYVTAKDVAYSLGRITNPETASTGAWLFNGRIDESEPFKAINDSTFQLKLATPFGPMLGILSMQYCSIVPQKIAEHYGKEFRKNPVGTGPFRFKAWREHEALIMERNPQYFEKDVNGRQLPQLPGIRVSFLDNKRNAFLLFKEGGLDLLSGIDAAYKDDLLTGEGQLKGEWQNQARLLRSPYLNTEYLGFLMEGNPNKALASKKVRQAVNYGIDRTKMMRYLRNGIGIPATSGFVPPGLPSFDPKAVQGYTYQPEKARQLLKEAGYENGKGVPTLVLETTDSYKDLCTYIQKQLGEIGLKVELELHPAAFLRDKIAKGKSGFFRASWIGDYPDAETYLTVLYGGNPAPPNYTRFKNAAYDELYREALLENDNARRMDLYRQMDRIIVEEAPIVPLFYDEVLRFVRKDVEGLGVNAFNLLSLKNASFAQ